MEDVTTEATITRINGNANRGGWRCEFTALNDSDLFGQWQNIRVPWRSAFGGASGPLRTAFNGWVLPSRLQFDRAVSQARFVAETTDGIYRRGWLQGLGLADVTDEAVGYETRENYHQWGNLVAGATPRMTLARIVEHILGYYDNYGVNPATNPDWVAHTNSVYHPTENPHGWITLDNVDFAGSARVNKVNVRETDNLWTRLREIARWEFYEIMFDKTDTLWYAPHPMYDDPLPNPVMTFDEGFMRRTIAHLAERSQLQPV